MANKRELKKAINGICDELLVNAVAATLYGAEPPKNDDADALLFSILKTQRNYVCRVSHPEPGIPQKAYYKDLREKLAAELGTLADQVQNL